LYSWEQETPSGQNGVIDDAKKQLVVQQQDDAKIRLVAQQTDDAKKQVVAQETHGGADDLAAFMRILLRNTSLALLPIPYPLTTAQLAALAGTVRVSPSLAMHWDVMASRFRDQHRDFLYDSFDDFLNAGLGEVKEILNADLEGKETLQNAGLMVGEEALAPGAPGNIREALQAIRVARRLTYTEDAWSTRHKACTRLFRVLLARSGVDDAEQLPDSEILVDTV
jgi:hypothetical protein